MLRYIALLLILVLCSGNTTAYDSSYEEAIAIQLAEGKTDDEVAWLQANGRQFISLFTNYSTAQPKGAIILLHGMGGHADWPEVINPLRDLFADNGWATLSLQLAVFSPEKAIADYGGTLSDTKRRIKAGVAHLQGWRFTNIVVVGYSFGAASAVQALSAKDIKNVNALIGIRMQAHPFLSPKLKLLKKLESIDIPVLDVYGSHDTPEVRDGVDDRRLAARKNGNNAYRQMQIEGADHYFTGLTEVLVKRSLGWLSRVTPGEELVSAVEEVDESKVKQEAKSGE
jgi:pimeloyl-ACP methyl ester carboxylesterase